MYGKLFEMMYDGTLVEDWRALVTFQQMIILCDADGVIDMTPQAISRRTGIPIEHIKAGIEVLEQGDPYSRSPDEDGRRIKRLDDHRPWGWYIVNHDKYKNRRDADEVRARNRERKRRQRERDKQGTVDDDISHVKSPNVWDVTQGHAESRHTDTDTDTEKKENIKKKKDQIPFDQFWSVYPHKQGKLTGSRKMEKTLGS